MNTMPPRINGFAAALLAGLGMVALETPAAVSQDDPPKSGQAEAPAAPAKQTDQKKPAPKTVEVHFKVSVEDGGDVPAKTKIEISGREAACGSLQTDDVMLTVDEEGEAVAKGLPPCTVMVKVNQTGYMPWRKTFDLTHVNQAGRLLWKETSDPARFNEPVQITLEREH
jgi:hypothetical protein